MSEIIWHKEDEFITMEMQREKGRVRLAHHSDFEGMGVKTFYLLFDCIPLLVEKLEEISPQLKVTLIAKFTDENALLNVITEKYGKDVFVRGEKGRMKRLDPLAVLFV
jgi:hypothetical protein